MLKNFIIARRQFIIYVAIGLTALAIDTGLFYFFGYIVGISILLANIIGMLVGMIVSFFLNVRVNFKTSDQLHRRFVLFFLVAMSGIIFSTVFLYVTTQLLPYDPLLMKFLSLFGVLALQYTLNSRYTFSS